VVTFVELDRGILLVAGLLSRLAASLLTITPTVALVLVKVNVGLIAPQGTGVEPDLALIAGLLVILLAGPGKLSQDRALGLERDAVEEQTA
jgi:putative oxidoreductase